MTFVSGSVGVRQCIFHLKQFRRSAGFIKLPRCTDTIPIQATRYANIETYGVPRIYPPSCIRAVWSTHYGAYQGVLCRPPSGLRGHDWLRQCTRKLAPDHQPPRPDCTAHRSSGDGGRHRDVHRQGGPSSIGWSAPRSPRLSPPVRSRVST